MKKEMITLRKNDNIEDLLEFAMKEEQFIYTDELRGIGKTTALINFAKKHNFGVITYNIKVAENLIKKFNYQHIYFYRQLRGMRFNVDHFVVDECIDIEEIIKTVDIVTGFINRKYIFNKIYSDNETIEQLDINKSKLLQKINKSQDNNNQSDYKMLINNLLKTIEVRDMLKNPNKDATINNQYHFDTLNLPNVVNTDDLIKDLKNFSTKQFSINYKYDI